MSVTDPGSFAGAPDSLDGADPFGDTDHLGTFDVAIIGAGPAGMAAAATAAEHGLRVALLDAGRQLGGQYYRHPAPGLTAPWLPNLYHGWQQFEQLVTRVETASRIEVLFGHQVYAIEPGFRVLTDRGTVEAPNVILATGAYERVVPFPGWDLPGVFTAGGAQALLKGNLVLPGHRVIVAGTGPLLLPVAAGLATAGAQVLGLYEANHIRGYATRPLPLLTNPAKLAEGLDYARQLTRARIPLHTGRMVIEAQGTDTLEAVVIARPDGTDPRRIACDTLAIGYGLAPQIDLALTLGAKHKQLSDGTTALRVDRNLRTSVPGLYTAGETIGVAGADTALLEGEIAGLAVARAVTGATEETKAGLASRASAAARPRLTRQIPTVSTSPETSPSESSDQLPDKPSGLASRASAAARARLTRQTPTASTNPDTSPDESSDQLPDKPSGLASRASAAARARLPRRATKSPSPDTSAPLAPSPGFDPPVTDPTLLRRRTRQRTLADLLRARHPIPAAWRDHLTAETLVCRCEEVPAEAVTEAVKDLGATDARTVKLLTRAGMGWCQGRVCGYAVACLARPDAADPPSPTDLLAAAKRPLARPVPLGVLAAQDRRNK